MNLSVETGFSFGGPLEKIQSGFQATQEVLGSDRYWMREALKESLSGCGVTNPNPAVGCVLVDEQGVEISRGATEPYLGLHAEKVAFQKVGDLRALQGATAYVTLEPCSHVGNQPPCVDLFLSTSIRRIVIACTDPNPLVNGEGVRKLRAAGKEVAIGVLGSEAKAWNFSFFASQILKRPVYVLKWAQTLDGQLADDFQNSHWITGASARAYTHWLRQRYDTILIGAGTALRDFPQLNVRNCELPIRTHPLPIILDPRGKCFQASPSDQARLLQNTFSLDRRTVLITTEAAVRENRQNWMFKHPSISIFTLQGVSLLSELSEFFLGREIPELLGHPLQSIFVEGGPQTLTLFLKAGLGDLLHVFIAPKMTGGYMNRIRTFQLLQEQKSYHLASSFRLDSDVVMEMIPQSLSDKLNTVK